VCGGFGFPYGTASTKRVRLVGKCLVAGGIPFHVLHIGPSSFDKNREKCGEFDGMTFEYLSPSVSRPAASLARIFFYLWGMLQLPVRLLKHRRDIMLYIYYQGDVIDLWALLLGRLLRIPTVQEACEWWPGTDHSNRFVEWSYRRIMFRWSDGAMPISHEIERRIRELAGPRYPTCSVPVLVDPGEKGEHSRSNEGKPSHPVFVWCGMVDGYQRDVLFLIDGMARLTTPPGSSAALRIVGPCSEKCRTEVVSYARSKGVSAERIEVLGFVSEGELWSHCCQADALLMPLWNDDRSCTRFPTKLGQYVASGRPVVTANVGETRYFLTEDTAVFYGPGDPEGLALALERLLGDRTLSGRIASRATEEVLPRLDFRGNISRISDWFRAVHSRVRHV